VLAAVAELGADVGDELVLDGAAADEVGPVVQIQAELREVRAVLDDTEVDEREPVRVAPFDFLERLLPEIEVELRRRRRRQHGAAWLDADARRVARIERPVAVEVGDVVRRVPGRREAIEAEDVFADDVHVLLRYRREFAPERVERVAVQPSRASFEALGRDQVRCPDLRDVHLERRVLADEYAGGARVVEVDVAEQQMVNIRELDALLGEAALEGGDPRRGAAGEER
jgi:hypothetical protein